MKDIRESVESFAEEVRGHIKGHYEKNYPLLPVPEVKVSYGKKYAKIISEGSVWGFIALKDGSSRGMGIVTTGELFKAASWSTPARHARGSILNGTANYGVYGPVYLR